MRKYRSFESRSLVGGTRRASSASAAVRLIWLICLLPGVLRNVRCLRVGMAARRARFAVEGTLPRLLNRNSSRDFASAALAIALLGACALPAHASIATLTLSGVFNGTTTDPATGMGTPVITDTITGTGAPTLTANEPFTLTGVFDTSGPNLIAGLTPPFLAAGWVDYAPLSVTLTVGGKTFSVATYDPSIPGTGGPGLTVAIFGDTTVFSPPPRRAARSAISRQASFRTPSQTARASSATGRTCPRVTRSRSGHDDVSRLGFLWSRFWVRPMPRWKRWRSLPPTKRSTPERCCSDSARRGVFFANLRHLRLEQSDKLYDRSEQRPLSESDQHAEFLLGPADGPGAIDLGVDAHRVCRARHCGEVARRERRVSQPDRDGQRRR